MCILKQFLVLHGHESPFRLCQLFCCFFASICRLFCAIFSNIVLYTFFFHFFLIFFPLDFQSDEKGRKKRLNLFSFGSELDLEAGLSSLQNSLLIESLISKFADVFKVRLSLISFSNRVQIGFNEWSHWLLTFAWTSLKC